jgi:hypothetical protein
MLDPLDSRSEATALEGCGATKATLQSSSVLGKARSSPLTVAQLVFSSRAGGEFFL